MEKKVVHITSNIADIAEKEKYDFVSGQFLYCKNSFNEFEKGKSYWFEYIGNDTYIGRSDNILNQKFFITPKQLYTQFGTKETIYVVTRSEEHADYVEKAFYSEDNAEKYCEPFNSNENAYQRGITECVIE